MPFLPYTSLPPVLASRGARDIFLRAATEYVTYLAAADSRTTYGGYSGAYLNALELHAGRTFGIPQYTGVYPISISPPAGSNEKDGVLHFRCSGASTGAGANPSGYGNMISQAESLPGFPAAVMGPNSGNTVIFRTNILPEARMSYWELMAHNAPVINRAASIGLEYLCYGFTGTPTYTGGGVTWDGATELEVVRGYNSRYSRSDVPGLSFASATAVGGYGNTTTNFGTVQPGSVGSSLIQVPLNPSGNAGYGYIQVRSTGAATVCRPLMGYRAKDPISTVGMSITPMGVGGQTYSYVPASHGSCQPALRAVCQYSRTVIIDISYGINETMGSGLDADTCYTNAKALIAWYQAALPDKTLLFVWNGYTPRPDNSLLNYATRNAEYSKQFHVAAAACRDMGAEYIAVNGGLLFDRNGNTLADEAVVTPIGAWSSGTTYTTDQTCTVTVGNMVYQFSSECDGNLNNDPMDERKRGFWRTIRNHLSQEGTTEVTHARGSAQIKRADLFWTALMGPHWWLNGSGTTATYAVLPMSSKRRRVPG